MIAALAVAALFAVSHANALPSNGGGWSECVSTVPQCGTSQGTQSKTETTDYDYNCSSAYQIKNPTEIWDRKCEKQHGQGNQYSSPIGTYCPNGYNQSGDGENTVYSKVITQSCDTGVIQYDACDLAQECPTDCSYKGGELPDGMGGYKNCPAITCEEPANPVVTIKAYKVVCANETDLPNWGTTGAQKPSMINANTAADYVSARDRKCAMVSGWGFEWGLPGQVTSPAKDLIGSGGAGWNAFDSVTGCGPAQATISAAALGQNTEIRVKENLQEGYLPFAGDNVSGDLQNHVSAEFYCHTDILNYDNYDFIRGAAVDSTYYCVAFNVLIEQPKSINGVCGPAAKVYPYDATDFDGLLCAAGNTGQDAWQFPAQGGSVTWTCYGEYGGSDATDCTATRETESTPVDPTDGVCGLAATNYAYNATGFVGEFCSAGILQEGQISFPAQGGSVSWTCYGENEGAGTTCTATRASAPSQQATSSSSSGSSSGQYAPGFGPMASRGVAPQVLGSAIDLDDIAHQISQIRQKVSDIASQVMGMTRGVLGAATQVATGVCDAGGDNSVIAKLRAQLCR